MKDTNKSIQKEKYKAEEIKSEIDLNESEHFLKANWDRSQIDPT